jgi:hypothetical protein
MSIGLRSQMCVVPFARWLSLRLKEAALLKQPKDVSESFLHFVVSKLGCFSLLRWFWLQESSNWIQRAVSFSLPEYKHAEQSSACAKEYVADLKVRKTPVSKACPGRITDESRNIHGLAFLPRRFGCDQEALP